MNSRSLKDLDHQVQIDLKHLQTIISKNRYKMVPENATYILDRIIDMDHILKLLALDKQSSGLNQVYHCIAELVKFCDVLLLNEVAANDKYNIRETLVNQLKKAIQNLVRIAVSPNELDTRRQDSSKMYKTFSLPEISPQDASDVMLPRPPVFHTSFNELNQFWNDQYFLTSSGTMSWHNSDEYSSSRREFFSSNSSAENEAVPPLSMKTDKVSQGDSQNAPPLPVKKKHVMIFMEMFYEWEKYKKEQCFARPFSSPANDSFGELLPIPPAHLPPSVNQTKDVASDVHSTSILDSMSLIQTSQTQAVVPDLIGKEDVSEWLLFLNREDGGPNIHAGYVDALIVRATTVNRNDLLFSEAFLTTYRTFIKPHQLIQKLIDRYHHFNKSSGTCKQRITSQSVSLLIRIIANLIIEDLEKKTMEMMVDFEYELLWNGELDLAKVLRMNFLERYRSRSNYTNSSKIILPCQKISASRKLTLLEFKPRQIAEQMTLLDAELFSRIETPEILIWVNERGEERSYLNLTRFTEHFNKISYWARSQILEQGKNYKDRNHYVKHFIEIIKNLREMNNFNSYFALVAALDSSPIRRLDLENSVVEEREKYSALIGPAENSKAYRNALAQSQPPCIPYLGLILKDVTSANECNDKLSNGMINFSKRWLLFCIVKNVNTFREISYKFERQENIITFFNNFDASVSSDEILWKMSESIQAKGTL